MKRLVIFLIVICVSCAGCSKHDNVTQVKGKFVFYSLRDPGVGWASYILKDGKIKLLGKKLTSPVFSPDGQTIAATTENGIVLLNEEGQQKDFITIGDRPGKLRWSPDGSKILYSIKINDKRKSILRQINFLTKEDSLILDMGEGIHMGGISFSPDGRKILVCVDHRDRDKVGIFILNSDGTNLKKFSKFGISDKMWLPDGKHIIYYTNVNEEGKQINKKFGAFFKLNIETGEVVKLQDLTILPWLSFINLSKDGKYYYFSRGQGEDGQHIVLWPVDNFEKEISITKCVPIGRGLSQDLDPDWFQG